MKMARHMPGRSLWMLNGGRCCNSSITCVRLFLMGSKKRPRKDTDYETGFWCAGGAAILREEVWVDENEEVVRYNLAFLMPHLFYRDNGRVLGFDNAHGVHERHYMGTVTEVEFVGFVQTSERFYREVEAIRRSYEGKSIH